MQSYDTTANKPDYIQIHGRPHVSVDKIARIVKDRVKDPMPQDRMTHLFYTFDNKDLCQEVVIDTEKGLYSYLSIPDRTETIEAVKRMDSKLGYHLLVAQKAIKECINGKQIVQGFDND